MLQVCFECTNWQIFREAATGEGGVDLEEYVSSVCGNIDDITTTRRITFCPNQKLWLNGEVWPLLKARDSAFRSGEAWALRTARRELEAGIKRAKATSCPQGTGSFLHQRPWSKWRGIRSITGYIGRDTECPRDPFLPGALNTFHARF